MRRSLIALVMLALAGCNLSANTPAPTPPASRIEFVTPANNVIVPAGQEVIIELIAQDPAGVARVQLLVDDLPHLEATPVAEPSVPVFVVDMNWLAEGVGRHGMTAVSYRANGSISATESIVVEVADATADVE
jgi:hypothetical protein